jgi:hypothetical protein
MAIKVGVNWGDKDTAGDIDPGDEHDTAVESFQGKQTIFEDLKLAHDFLLFAQIHQTTFLVDGNSNPTKAQASQYPDYAEKRNIENNRDES